MEALVVAAHPDDEVLGCGGTIARLAKEGNQLHVAILGEGITARYSKPEQADKALLRQLHEKTESVRQLLGAQDVSLHHLPDNRFDTLPLLDVVKIVDTLVERFKPQVIYTHHGGDLNIDHHVVNRAVITAARPVAGQSVRAIYAFEVPSSTEWSFHQLQPIFRPNVFSDIASTLEIKLKAMQLYESEARQFPHPRSRKALEAIAHRWGSAAGLEAAEAFELIRLIR